MGLARARFCCTRSQQLLAHHAAYEAAFTVYTPEKYPQQNAAILTNMRIAQRALDRGLAGGTQK